MAAIIFFIVLTLACGTDILANNLHIAFERLIEILQFGVFVGPVVGFTLAYYACIHLQRTGAHPIQRPVGGIIYRTAEGGYHTVGDVHDGDHAGGDHAGSDHALGHSAVEETANGHGAAGDWPYSGRARRDGQSPEPVVGD